MYWSTPICRYKVLFLSYLFTTTTAASSALSTFEFQSGWTTVSSANSFIWNFLFPFSDSTIFRIIEIVSTINHYHICFQPLPILLLSHVAFPVRHLNQSPRINHPEPLLQGMPLVWFHVPANYCRLHSLHTWHLCSTLSWPPF